MAIKLVRKNNEVVNTPIKLNDNLFVRVKDLAKETDQTIEELVNYFIEEALKQVVFDDEVEGNNTLCEADEVECEVTDIINEVIDVTDKGVYTNDCSYDLYLEKELNEAFGCEWRTNGRIRNTITQNLKSKLKVNSVEKIRELYITNPELIKNMLSVAIKQRKNALKDSKQIDNTIKNTNSNYTSVFENMTNGFNTWLTDRMKNEFGENYRQYRVRIMSGLKKGLTCDKVEDLYKAFEQKPDIVKKYANHYIELAKSGHARGGSNEGIGLPIININDNSSIKKIITSNDTKANNNSDKENKPKVYVIPNTDERNKMISKLRCALKEKDKTRSFDACISESYKRMKSSYGININEEKKNYFRCFGVKCSSGLEAVKSFDELWNIFFPILQDICGIDYNKIAS